MLFFYLYVFFVTSNLCDCPCLIVLHTHQPVNLHPMPHDHEQHLYAQAERIMTALLSADTRYDAKASRSALAFKDTRELFRSDFSKFLRFLQDKHQDPGCRFAWTLSRVREGSIHFKVYITSFDHQQTLTVTLRLHVHVRGDGSVSDLTLQYRPGGIIDLITPSRVQAFFRKRLYSLGLFSL